MKTSVTSKTASSSKAALALVKVRELVLQGAQDLASANAVLGRVMGKIRSNAELARALEQSRIAQSKVLDASVQLTLVNQALESEVDERQSLDRRLATATRRGNAARRAAFHDALTGLPNRALFNDRLKHALAQVTRHHGSLAVMFLDLDGFKAINDQYGHAVGDALLRTVADRLEEGTRSDDTVSRHGGDEFLYLCMGHASRESIAALAEKMVERISAPCKLAVGALTAKASIGISIYPQHGSTPQALIASADKAMYRAKKARCGFAFADQVQLA